MRKRLNRQFTKANENRGKKIVRLICNKNVYKIITQDDVTTYLSLIWGMDIYIKSMKTLGKCVFQIR